MPSKHSPERVESWFRDIVDAIDDIRRFVGDLDYDGYEANDLVQAAVERKLLVVSEAARRIGDGAIQLAPGPDWERIRRICSVLRHDYDDISGPMIWDTVQTKLMPLREAIMMGPLKGQQS
jgi:uncharacterized protein with HEPN domain